MKISAVYRDGTLEHVGELIIRVKDTGLGMSKRDRKKIFNGFYRSSNRPSTSSTISRPELAVFSHPHSFPVSLSTLSALLSVKVVSVSVSPSLNGWWTSIEVRSL